MPNLIPPQVEVLPFAALSVLDQIYFGGAFCAPFWRGRNIIPCPALCAASEAPVSKARRGCAKVCRKLTGPVCCSPIEASDKRGLDALAAAYEEKFPRRAYGANVLRRAQRISGADLQGKAGQYGGHYRHQRLLALQFALTYFGDVHGLHLRRCLKGGKYVLVARGLPVQARAVPAPSSAPDQFPTYAY